MRARGQLWMLCPPTLECIAIRVVLEEGSRLYIQPVHFQAAAIIHPGWTYATEWAISGQSQREGARLGRHVPVRPFCGRLIMIDRAPATDDGRGVPERQLATFI